MQSLVPVCPISVQVSSQYKCTPFLSTVAGAALALQSLVPVSLFSVLLYSPLSTSVLSSLSTVVSPLSTTIAPLSTRFKCCSSSAKSGTSVPFLSVLLYSPQYQYPVPSHYLSTLTPYHSTLAQYQCIPLSVPLREYLTLSVNTQGLRVRPGTLRARL